LECSLRYHQLIFKSFQKACFIVQRAANNVRAIEKGRNLKIFNKSIKDPCTVADLTAQKIIEMHMQREFPNLSLIGNTFGNSISGEECDEKVSEIDIEMISTDELNEVKFDENHLFQAFKQKQDNFSDEAIHEIMNFKPELCTAWIDPVDGTASFIRGELDVVTILIGISIGDKAKIGIVHKI
jgi:fructose-1,6-bisphosphatase/inositol monophosphatase family enzyme